MKVTEKNKTAQVCQITGQPTQKRKKVLTDKTLKNGTKLRMTVTIEVDDFVEKDETELRRVIFSKGRQLKAMAMTI